MASISTISYPGVEVREYDESVRATVSTGTTVVIPGFASQGPVEEWLTIGTITEFETVYGKPTNAAERYFYHTVDGLLKNCGANVTVLTCRIPYGTGDGDNVANAFTLLSYPCVPFIKNKENKKGYDYFEVEDGKDLVKLELEGGQEVEATSVEFDLVKASSASDVTNITLNSLSLPDGYLPTPTDTTDTYSNKPKLTWSYNESEEQITTEGSISIDEKEDDFTLNFTFALKKDEKTPVGILKIAATYQKQEDEYDTISLKGDSVTATTKEVLAYVVSPYLSSPTDDGTDEYNDITYMIGAPVSFQISLLEYYSLLDGSLFSWDNEPYKYTDISGENTPTEDTKFGMIEALKHSAFIAINPSRSIINDSFEGLYLGCTDNIFNAPESGMTYNSINSVKITSLSSNHTVDGKGILPTDFLDMSKGRLDFYLDTNNKGSLSQTLQKEVTTFDTSANEYDDTLNVGVFKLNNTTTSNEVMKLSYNMVEKYNASLGKTRQYSISTKVSPQTYFIEHILESSTYLTILVNPFIAENIRVDIDNNLLGKIRIYSNKLLSNLAFYENKYIGDYFTNISNYNPTKILKYALNLANSSISSWVKVCQKAGVSLNVLKETIKGDSYATFKPCDSIFPLGTYTATKTANKSIGNVPTKLNRCLSLLKNDETYPNVDVLVEGGLCTIYAYANANTGENTSSIISQNKTNKFNTFDDTINLIGIEDLRTSRSSYSEDAQAIIDDATTVRNEFLSIANTFQNGGRGDTFFVSDVLRGILLKGKNTKVQKLFGQSLKNNSYNETDTVNHSFSTSIYWPIKHLTESFISSFSATFNQWFKVNDSNTGEKIWVPSSGFIAGLMVASDMLYGPWSTAAGMERGIVNGVLDVAFDPERDQIGELYKICINSVPSLNNSGVTVWGIRTMSKKASAFDQIPCRRTFLYMNKLCRQYLQHYVFEPNTDYTRLSVYNELYPLLESIRQAGGIYEFSLVCDTSNNTATIINNGDMVVSISASPVRFAEKVILELTATRYGVTSSETIA